MKQQEKETYIRKLERVRDGVENVRQLPGNSVLTPDMLDRLTSLRQQAVDFLPKLRNDEFEIAVVGLEKSGKSSFANALAGIRMLPVGDERCTYTSTCVRSGPEEKARVSFFSERDFTAAFQDNLKTLGIPNPETYTPENLTLANYEKLFDALDENTRKLYEKDVNQDIRATIENIAGLKQYLGRPDRIYSGEELDSPEFLGFITDKSKAPAVEHIIIESSQLRDMPTAVLYDVPGFNSPTEMHQRQTLERMRKADAIIMVARADEPSITREALKILEKSDEDGTPLKDKLFVFANRADRATDLEKNKNTTYDEWITRNHFIAPDKAARIVFGSALASTGDELAKEGLKRFGIEDGIPEIRAKLQAYYSNERFEVQKKNIDRILYDVEKVVQDAELEAAATYSGKELMDLAVQRVDEFRDALEKELNALKARINEHVLVDFPLAALVRGHIDEGITVGKYHVTDEEKKRLHEKHAGTGKTEQPDKLDGDIRDERFREMYDDFTKSMLRDTDVEHNIDRENILDIFMDVMHVEKGSPSYDSLREKAAEFCRIDETSDHGYYMSLIERFARDIFEILIKYSRASRAGNFRDGASNFLSLSVFFDAVPSDSGEAVPNIEEPASRSVLWKLLLFPETVLHPMLDTASQLLTQLTGLNPLGKVITQLLSELIDKRGASTTQVLENAFRGTDLGMTEASVSSRTKDILRDLIDEEDTHAITLRDIMSGANVPDSRISYDVVLKQFDEDIEALRLVLQRAVLPAVNIDRAFSARESKMIEDIVERVDSPDFGRFVTDNFQEIESAKYAEFERARIQSEMDQAARREIRSIVKMITDAES